MSMLESITQFIENRTTTLAWGVNLFSGFWPQDTPENAVLISEPTQSPGPPEFPDQASKMISVLTRSRNYRTGFELAMEVYDGLLGTTTIAGCGHNLPQIESGPEYLAMTIRAVGHPGYVGEDPKWVHNFSTNYIFEIEQAECGP